MALRRHRTFNSKVATNVIDSIKGLSGISQGQSQSCYNAASQQTLSRLFHSSAWSGMALGIKAETKVDRGVRMPPPNPGFSKIKARKAGACTLADYPRIVHMWHPTKNGGTQPEDYMHGSRKTVWMQCDGCPTCGQQHKWDAQAQDLTQFGGEFVCGACESRGRWFCSCRSIATNKRLKAEWHEDNPPPDTIALASNGNHKWRCSDSECGHVWEATPRNRRNHGTNCPECAQKWNGKLKYGSLAEARPDLVAEWDEGRNSCAPTEVTCGSDKSVYWVCEGCGESWKARLSSRALRCSGCPSCRQLVRRQPRKYIRLSSAHQEM